MRNALGNVPRRRTQMVAAVIRSSPPSSRAKFPRRYCHSAAASLCIGSGIPRICATSRRSCPPSTGRCWSRFRRSLRRRHLCLVSAFRHMRWSRFARRDSQCIGRGVRSGTGVSLSALDPRLLRRSGPSCPGSGRRAGSGPHRRCTSHPFPPSPPAGPVLGVPDTARSRCSMVHAVW